MITELSRILLFPGFLFTLFIGLLYMGIDRKIAARLQNRIGPPIIQPFYDAVKLFTKDTVKPKNSSWIFTYAPIVSLAALLTTSALLPILGSLYLDIDNIFLVIYFLLFSSVLMAFGALDSGNPYAITGAIRKITLLLATDLPIIIVFFVPVVLVKTFSIEAIALSGMLASSLPLATIALLICLQGSMHKAPFDLPDAPQELIAGMYTEYSGALLGIIELAHAAKSFVLISLSILLFFGGAQTIAIFLAKFFALGLLVTLIRAIFARLKIAQTLKFYWLIVAPLALIDLLRMVLL